MFPRTIVEPVDGVFSTIDKSFHICEPETLLGIAVGCVTLVL